MTSHSSSQAGRYLYAITFAPEMAGLSGLLENDVYWISDGGLAAVVSDVPNVRLRPERQHLAAHQNVLRKLMEHETVLPMSFGIIAENSKAILRILTRHKPRFTRELERVAGRVEMGLRVAFDVPNIFEYFVNTHDELRAARDRLFGNYREPSQEDKIEVGRLFDRLINEDREAYTEKVEEILGPICVETKSNPARNEREILNLACLVERGEIDSFESGIFEAAKQFDNNFAFDYSGPWAPHNFVEVGLKL
jgi:hypothetical protein